MERLTSAARDATARGAPESAAAYLRRALAEPPPPEVSARLQLELGRAEFSAGQQSWRRHLEAALGAATDGATRTSIAPLLAVALGLDERPAQAIEVLDRVAAGIGERDDETRVVLEATAVMCGLLDIATTRSVADRAAGLLALARERPVPRVALAVAAYVAVRANEPAEQAAEMALRAVAAGPRSLPDSDDLPWFATAVMALIQAERNDDARPLLDAALAEARATANGFILPRVLGQRAILALRCGDLAVAEEDARSLLETPSVAPPLLSRLAATSVLVERGALEGAESALASAAAHLQSSSGGVVLLRHARGGLRFAQRRFREALADFRPLGEIVTAIGAPSPSFLPWRSSSALALLALGEADQARRLSEEEVELARAFGAPRTLGVALRAAGLVAGGGRGEALLREAIEILDGPHTGLEQARAQTDLGALLRRDNRRAEARPILRDALDAAHRAGACMLADRAEIELRSTGARPRRVLLMGPDSLTASERRVAELAAEGLTNREIAQHLFITARTVDGHLTNVFQKLDIEVRTELPAALRAPA